MATDNGLCAEAVCGMVLQGIGLGGWEYGD